MFRPEFMWLSHSGLSVLNAANVWNVRQGGAARERERLARSFTPGPGGRDACAPRKRPSPVALRLFKIQSPALASRVPWPEKISRALLTSCCAALAWCAGCDRGTAPAKPPAAHADANWFADATATSGLDFAHRADAPGNYHIVESIGSGGAFLDFDNDGRLDLYLIHNAHPTNRVANRLYHQEADGKFRDVSAGSGLDVAGHGQGLAVGDVNNDGRPEVFVTEYDGVRLFLNNGAGKFTDVTMAAGITNHQWSVPAAFFDYDRDGWLDLVVGNYLDVDPTQQCPDAKGRPEFCGPHGFHSTITRLWRNLGAGVGAAPRFEDVTVSSGLARAPGKAMQTVCADFDGDRWPDIFITDDGLPNRLYINQRNGTFKEEAVARGVAYTGLGGTAANMGIALGDTDGDGWFDLFVPHLGEENHTLWRQGPRGLFQDFTGPSGLLSMPWHGTGFGAVFADFNHDGAPDLAVANGRIRRRTAKAQPKLAPGVTPFWSAYAEPAQLFANSGEGRFREISSANSAFCGEALVGRGLVAGDFDNDGATDLLLVGLASPARLLRNTAAPRGHWLGVRVIDPALGGRDAHGAEVVVEAGGRRAWRLVQPAYSYASSHDPRVQFGLGKAGAVDSIRVRWPDGTEEIFSGGAADRYVTLRRGAGTLVKEPSDGRK